MSRLIAILKAAHCRSTHHYFAIDALEQINTAQGQRLGQLLLKYHDEYLVGAQAPDKSFRDFENHVLYVAEDPPWGGAIEACERWRQTAVEHLNAGRWKKAAYACGVLSHYFTDPMMPLHTACNERAAVLHRALEWRVFKSYPQLSEVSLRRSRALDLRLSQASDWISEAVQSGARLANQYFQPLLTAYDFPCDRDSDSRPFSPELQQMLGDLIGMAVTGWAKALVRLADEATRKIPDLSLGATTLLAVIDMPLAWSVRCGSERVERRAVRAIDREIARSGQLRHRLPPEIRHLRSLRQQPLSVRLDAEGSAGNASHMPTPLCAQSSSQQEEQCRAPEGASLPADASSVQAPEAPATESDRTMGQDARWDEPGREGMAGDVISGVEPTIDATRRLDAIRLPDEPTSSVQLRQPVVRVPRQPSSDRHRLPVRAPAARSECTSSDAETDSVLSPTHELSTAPVIGTKTARRFEKLGIRTVGDLLACSVEEVVAAIDTPWLTPKLMRDWQDQLRLLCEVPGLSPKCAELLVELDYCDAERLAQTDVDAFHQQLIELGKTAAGTRVLGGKPIPKRREIAGWIDAARRHERSEPANTEKCLRKLAG